MTHPQTTTKNSTEPKTITLHHAQRSVDLPLGGCATENYIACSYADWHYLNATRRGTRRHNAITISVERADYVTDLATDGDFTDADAVCARLGFTI